MTDGLKYFKSQFAEFQHVHFNNAGLQPITQAAKDKIIYWAERFYKEGYASDADYQADVFNTRVRLSELIKCQPQEIAFFSSTAGAVNQVAFSIGLSADDEVLMWDQEFSSHMYPWREACEVAFANLILVESEQNLFTSVEKIKSKINDKTKVLAFSWVQFMSGAMMTSDELSKDSVDEIYELIKFAKEKGVLVFVDIIQGLGYLDFNLWQYGVDAVMGGSHKWLCSPVGVGYLAIRKELALKLKPRTIGATTFGTCDDPTSLVCEPKRDASRFEPGSKQVLEITALGASIEVIQKAGLNNIYGESMRLTRLMGEKLIELNYKLILPIKSHSVDLKHKSLSEMKAELNLIKTPFLNFQPRNVSGEHEMADYLRLLSQHLNQHKILHVLRGPGLRFSFQAFNTEKEIDYVISVIRDFKL